VPGPIRLDAYSEPQADVTLLHPRADFYAAAHPGPDDVLLAIEVADTSLELDRTVKGTLYARVGIREAWLVDLAGDGIESHRTPGAQGYEDVGRSRAAPTALPGIDLPVDGILG